MRPRTTYKTVFQTFAPLITKSSYCRCTSRVCIFVVVALFLIVVSFLPQPKRESTIFPQTNKMKIFIIYLLFRFILMLNGVVGAGQHRTAEDCFGTGPEGLIHTEIQTESCQHTHTYPCTRGKDLCRKKASGKCC